MSHMVSLTIKSRSGTLVIGVEECGMRIAGKESTAKKVVVARGERSRLRLRVLRPSE